ncbi:hypothetical protein D3C72_1199540 [compost metagenome]
MELTFETARQRKAIGSRLARKIRQPEIFAHMRIQIVTRPMCHRRALQLRREPFAPVAMGSDLRQHVIHRALLDDFHLILMQRIKRLTDGANQLRLTRQGLRKME